MKSQKGKPRGNLEGVSFKDESQTWQGIKGGYSRQRDAHRGMERKVAAVAALHGKKDKQCSPRKASGVDRQAQVTVRLHLDATASHLDS